MIIIGLTGSIGMGKSTTSELFAKEGVQVHDSDATVHSLYSGKAAPLIEAVFPGTVIDGVVDRKVLGKFVIGDDENMKKLEAIVHPLVSEHRDNFIKEARKQNAEFVLLDIPLLFETGSEKFCDVVIVVSTSLKEQGKRVLSRPGMTKEKFEKILNSQTPDKVKRAKADFVIDTTVSVAHAHEQVIEILNTLKKHHA